MAKCGLVLLLFAGIASLQANDIVYLRGVVQKADGSAPGKSATIQLVCRESDPVRLTTTGKNGKFNLKVERDEFNHIARSLPATATDVGGGTPMAGPCSVRADLPGYESNVVDLGSFTIPNDLTFPKLVLKAK